jgi:hypothetical protein
MYVCAYSNLEFYSRIAIAICIGVLFLRCRNVLITKDSIWNQGNLNAVCGTRNKAKKGGRSTALFLPSFSKIYSLTTKFQKPLPPHYHNLPPPRSLPVNLVLPRFPLLLPIAAKKESSSILFRICK